MNSFGCEGSGFIRGPLVEKSKTFAFEVIKVCNCIRSNKREAVLTNQLIRSGTSIGANIREPIMPMEKQTLLQNCKLR